MRQGQFSAGSGAEWIKSAEQKRCSNDDPSSPSREARQDGYRDAERESKNAERDRRLLRGFKPLSITESAVGAEKLEADRDLQNEARRHRLRRVCKPKDVVGVVVFVVAPLLMDGFVIVRGTYLDILLLLLLLDILRESFPKFPRQSV